VLVPLRRAYASRRGAPVISRVDREIFRLRYFTYCSRCDFCRDACCRHGVDVDVENVERIMRHAERLEREVGRPAREWFARRRVRDRDFPGGSYTRTAVRDGGCVFLSRTGRGCLLHAYSLREGIDYHDLKPMVSVLFPVTFGGGVLYPAEEVEDGTLVCAGAGPTLYRGIREELRYYFGDPFVGELDELEAAAPS
jgi:Fe-S-cluster containining protein